jgi:hypothetical protein
MRISVKREVIELPPVDGWRRFAPGRLIIQWERQ